MDASKLKQLKQFVEQCKSDPTLLSDPSLSFFRDYIESLGGKVPSDDYKSKSHVEDSDEEELDDVEDEPQPYVEEEEPEIVESDIELDESDVVEADDEPPQKMGDSSVEVTEESHDASQEAKMQAMEAISDGKLEEAIEHLTKAIMLNPTSAIMYATRATVYIKMKKPNAAIRDASAALEINPDSAKGYKSRGIARAMLGQWGAAAKDLHLASNLDYDEEIAAVLKKISTSFAMDEVKKRKRLPVIPWMRNPVDVTLNHSCPLDSVPILHPKLVDTLQNMGFSSLFPVQIGVWHETIGPGSFERDLYITSPTGSGKTLAYALPIVQALSNRSIKCLRTLVVVPTRALAVQVKDVFAELGNAVGLSVGLAVGQSSIADEISELIEKPIPESSTCDPGDSTRELRSKVDILVATPGRLMDHVNNTKGFTLEHLCYLVVDEADRLLREAYQSWLPNVLRLAYSSNQCPSSFSLLKTFRTFGVERGFKGRPHPRLTKVILSATLTQDPSKLAQLDLHNPLFLTTGERRYQLPEQLKSFKVMCTSELKPLYLLALLEKMQGEKCIVFTSSVEKTHKLCDFLKSLGDLKIKMKEYSRLQRESTRSKTIRAFREGKIQVLISSDAMARGMDVEEVKNVISYDVPASIKIYIHRAGRTARAGQTGCCFTLLQKGEVKRFKTLLQKADKETCPEYSVPSESVESLCSIYPSASEKLKETSESGKYRKRKDNRVTQREGV